MPPKPRTESRLKDYKMLKQEADEDSMNLLKGLGKAVKPRGRTCGRNAVICILVTCFITIITGLVILISLTMMYPGESFSISGFKDMFDELTRKNNTFYRNFTEEHTSDDYDLLDIPDSRNISTVLNETVLSKNKTDFITTVLPIVVVTNGSFVNETIGPLDGREEGDFDLTLLENVKQKFLWMEDYVEALPLAIIIPICVGMGMLFLLPFVICCRRKIRRNRRRRLLGVLVTDLKANEKNFVISDSSDDEE